jgi:hypothetical protein
MGAAIYTVRPTALPPAIQAEVQTERLVPQQPTPPPEPSVPPAPARSQPPASKAAARIDCGTAWTGWVNVGGSVGNPCPSGCARGAELGQSYRAVGFPPRPQVKHKFQCWRE